MRRVSNGSSRKFNRNCRRKVWILSHSEVSETITKMAGSKYRLGYRFKIFRKKHNQSGTYGIGLLSNLRLTRPARNSMNLECSSHDGILKYVFVVTISLASQICRTCYWERLKKRPRMAQYPPLIEFSGNDLNKSVLRCVLFSFYSFT